MLHRWLSSQQPQSSARGRGVWSLLLRTYCNISVGSRLSLQRSKDAKVFARAAQEMKGQTTDLRDICSAATETSLGAYADLTAWISKEPSFDEERKRKLNAVASGIKAYCVRLGTVQGEAQKISTELDAISAMLKGGDDSLTPSDKKENLAKKIEGNEERIPEASVEIEDESGAQVLSDEDDWAINLGEKGITEYLHRKGVDFSDCFDAESLRARYRLVASGKWDEIMVRKRATQNQQRRRAELRREKSQDRRNLFGAATAGMVREENPTINYGGSTEQQVMNDPHPGAERRMVDPQRYVWELKAEVCRAKGVNPSSVDIWCAYGILDDSKRIYEYPQCQHSAIEMRMKGDTTRRTPNPPGIPNPFTAPSSYRQ